MKGEGVLIRDLWDGELRSRDKIGQWDFEEVFDEWNAKNDGTKDSVLPALFRYIDADLMTR